jgi:predicted TIM-barrel fold metal-dependent hydrolase
VTSLLRDFPDLRVIIVGHGGWGDDRYFRPLLERYPGFHVDVSFYHADQGLPGLVARYGPDRLLYGSGHPDYQMGGALMYVARARVSDEARTAIAGDNLRRLLAEVRL